MEIVVIDLETTGTTPTTGKIVEVGIVLLDTLMETKTILMDYVVHEDGITEKEVRDSWIIKNSTLTVAQIQHSVNFRALIPTIRRICEKYPVTAFNKKFDLGFLNSRGINTPNEFECPMLKLTPIMKLRNARGGYKWPKAEEAYKYVTGDESYVEKHRALADAFDECYIVEYCIRNKIISLES